MDYKDLKALSDGMMDDEAGVMMRILELRSPQCLDAFVGEAKGRPGAKLGAILSSAAVINCNEILTKAMPADLYEAYGKWGYGIFAKGKTHS